MINKLGPWKWAKYTQAYDASEFWHSSLLYAPLEKPKKQFILEASSIGDGVEGYAQQIKSLICSVPELYNTAQLLIEVTENSWYEQDETLDEIINIRDKFKEIINKINNIDNHE